MFERFIIDWILHVREIYCGLVWILFSFIKSLDIRVYHPYLFISVYPYSTRLRRLLRRSIPTAVMPRPSILSFIGRRTYYPHLLPSRCFIGGPKSLT